MKSLRCRRCGRDLTEAGQLLGDKEEVRRQHDAAHLLDLQAAVALIIEQAKEVTNEVTPANHRSLPVSAYDVLRLKELVDDYTEAVETYERGWEDEP